MVNWSYMMNTFQMLSVTAKIFCALFTAVSTGIYQSLMSIHVIVHLRSMLVQPSASSATSKELCTYCVQLRLVRIAL